jgi:hypothetical protein
VAYLNEFDFVLPRAQRFKPLIPSPGSPKIESTSQANSVSINASAAVADGIVFPLFVACLRRLRDAPNAVADIVGHQQCTVLSDGDANGPAQRLVILIYKAGHYVEGPAGRLAIGKSDKDTL